MNAHDRKLAQARRLMLVSRLKREMRERGILATDPHSRFVYRDSAGTVHKREREAA